MTKGFCFFNSVPFSFPRVHRVVFLASFLISMYLRDEPRFLSEAALGVLCVSAVYFSHTLFALTAFALRHALRSLRNELSWRTERMLTDFLLFRWGCACA
eukprot:RCo027135